MTGPTGRSSLLVAAVVAALAIVTATVRRAAAEQLVEYRDAKLTVRLTAVPATAVLDELAKATGAAVRGRVEDAMAITASFDALSLDEALRRLLPKQGFALKYDGDRLAAIELLDASGVAQPPYAPAVIRTPGQSAEDAAVQSALSALAIARQNGMASEETSPLEAVLGAGAPAP